MSYPSISKHFSTYFQPIFANTEDLKKEVFKIRYKVYCEELNYESTSKFPDSLEIDDYDEHSVHYLLRHRPSGQYAGCVRAVLPKKQNNLNTFPFEKIFPNQFSLMARSRQDFCEISRLAVPAKFRKRKGENAVPEGILFSPFNEIQNPRQKRQFPVIAFSLYWIAFSIGITLNLDGLVLMESRLARHLQRTGIISHMVSDFIDYRGKRALFVIKPSEFIGNLNPDIYQLFELIHKEVEQELNLQLLVKI